MTQVDSSRLEVETLPGERGLLDVVVLAGERWWVRPDLLKVHHHARLQLLHQAVDALVEDPLRCDGVRPAAGDLAHGVDGAVVGGHVASDLLRGGRRARHAQDQRVQPLETIVEK